MSLGSISASRTLLASVRVASINSSRPPYESASVRVIPLCNSVSELSERNRACACCGSLCSRPMADNRISLSTSSSRSDTRHSHSKSTSALISAGGRSQFCSLNAYKVNAGIPSRRAARIVARTASAPRSCPAVRGSPLPWAHRPLPSMMMATCCGRRLTSTKPMASEYHAAPKAARTPAAIGGRAKMALSETRADRYGVYESFLRRLCVSSGSCDIERRRRMLMLGRYG